jgi:hypothetical protein
MNRTLESEARELASSLGLAALTAEIERQQTADPGSATSPSATVPVAAEFSLQKIGETWTIRCDGESHTLKNTKGVQLLARLVADPGREFHVLDLTSHAPPGQTVDAGDAGELLDDAARESYRSRAESLRAELEEAEAWNDPGRAERARAELEALTTELTRAFGLGGRERRAGKAAERARVNVQRRIKDAIGRIEALSPAAGRHLQWAIRTGMYCSYDPS